VSGQLYAPATLPPGKEPPVRTGWEAETGRNNGKDRVRTGRCRNEDEGHKKPENLIMSPLFCMVT